MLRPIRQLYQVFSIIDRVQLHDASSPYDSRTVYPKELHRVQFLYVNPAQTIILKCD
jgi:hypothetical protein